MNRGIAIALAIGLAIAISWPLIIYHIYPVEPESVEPIIEISGNGVFSIFSKNPPKFLVGVGGLITFRGADFKVRGRLISIHHYTGIFRVETGETIVVLFMPRYRSIERGHEVGADDLVKLVASSYDAVLKGYMFITRRGIALMAVEVVIGNETFIGLPPYR